MTLLADLVAASNEVAATSSRSRKIAVLADLLQRLELGEVPIAAGLVSGLPRQGRVGVGFAAVYGVDEQAPAATPSLTIHDLDAVVTEIQHATGSGSGTRRKALLAARPRRKPTSSSDSSPASCGRARWPPSSPMRSRRRRESRQRRLGAR